MSEPFPYTIQGKLGQGGMGEVFRAWDPHTQRHVALKRITSPADPVLLQRFLREGELTARLDHPGILRVHHAGAHRNCPYIAYELIEGSRTLDEAFADLPLDQRLDLVLQAADALGHAHARGVVHRDVKPENLLVDREGRVKVADFGLATAADLERLTRTGTTLGTPYYMAPELISMKHGDVGPWTDVWALGVILYQALTDERPFGGNNLMELAAQILLTRPNFDLDPEHPVPRSLQRVCRRALRHASADRYPDAAAFARALRDRSTPTPRPRRWILLGALAGAIAVWGLSTLPAPHTPRPPPPAAPRDAPSSPEPPTLDQDPTTVAGFRALRGWALAHRDHPERPQVLRSLRRATRAPLARLRCEGGPTDPHWVTRLVLWGDERAWAYARNSGESWWVDFAAQRATRAWPRQGQTIRGARVSEREGRRTLWVARNWEVRRFEGKSGQGTLCWDQPRAEGPIAAFDLHAGSDTFAIGARSGGVWVSRAGARTEIPWGGTSVWTLRFDRNGEDLLLAGGEPLDGEGNFDCPLVCWSLTAQAPRWTVHGTGLWMHLEPLGDERWLGADANGGLVDIRDGAETRFRDPTIGGDDLLRLARAHATVIPSVQARDGAVFTISGHPTSSDRSWAVWDLETRALQRRVALEELGGDLVLSADGALLVLGLERGWVEVWGNPAGLDGP